jgi:hypothetical protein
MTLELAEAANSRLQGGGAGHSRWSGGEEMKEELC